MSDCPYIRNSDEGTSYCALNEDSVSAAYNQMKWWEQRAGVLLDENEELRARCERLEEALNYYADWNGEGKDWVITPRGQYDEISTVHKMGHKARAALKEGKDE